MPKSSGTICMAVYKPDLSLLRVQISSIQAQSLNSWNCVIGIDGADRHVGATIRQIVGDDSRFSVVEFKERVGFYHNFERILRLVEDEAAWVALADQDDNWYPNKLETLVACLGSSSMALGQARIVRATSPAGAMKVLGVTHRSFNTVAELIIDNVVSGALCVFKPALLAVALPFPQRTDVAYHDHWLALCAALQGGIASTPHVVQDYVQHDGNVIGEEVASAVIRRLGMLLRRSNGVVEATRYIVNHRWRWRVRMARVALARFEQLPTSVARSLYCFAADRPNWRLLFVSSVSFVRGRSSRMRVVSICAASFAAPFVREEISADA